MFSKNIKRELKAAYECSHFGHSFPLGIPFLLGDFSGRFNEDSDFFLDRCFFAFDSMLSLISKG